MQMSTKLLNIAASPVSPAGQIGEQNLKKLEIEKAIQDGQEDLTAASSSRRKSACASRACAYLLQNSSSCPIQQVNDTNPIKEPS